MDAELLNGVNSGEPDALKFSPGGFVGHISGEQRYKFTSNENNSIIRIRLGKKGWKGASGRFVLADEPRKHYDYNF